MGGKAEGGGVKFSSLFAGIGGFELGFEKAEMKCVCQVENNKYCIQVLEKYWPNVQRMGDIRDVRTVPGEIICGGDPCPSRSRMRRGIPAKHPDLSGYFLAVVGRSGPGWVVRENVPASDVVNFAAGLEALGYGVVIIELNARYFTGQSRRRQFCIGCAPALAGNLRQAIRDRQNHQPANQIDQATQEVANCVVTQGRMSLEDNFCYEPGEGLRVLDSRELEALQGFPRDWTVGFSRDRRRSMLGNAVPPPMTEWIGKLIKEAV